MLDSLPLDFIKTLFDQYAFNYDHHLKDVLAYQAPATARSLLYSASPEPLTAGLVLDLGCGTGLMGATMRDLATTLIGIDVSAGMLQHAKNTGLYDEMIEKDVLDYLAVTQCKAKYITAIEVLNYLGKTTEQLIEYSSKILQDGGWLIMTAEISTNEPIVFNHYARYAYTQEYLISILLTHGFDIKEIKKAPLRMHEESMVEGFYVIASLKHAHKELSA
jgi:predicted TPR repeat methyltransferase